MSTPPPLPPQEPIPASASSGISDDLRHRFPDLRPVKGAPPLFRINGCGMAMFGKRDADTETGTYLKNYGLTLLFVPVLPFACYRVADAPEGGWYFVGKERLGGVARIAAAAVLIAGLLLALGVAQSVRSGTPEARLSRALDEASTLAAEGDAVAAARKAQEAAGIIADDAERCLALADDYLGTALQSGTPETVLQAVDFLAESPYRNTRFRLRTEGLSKLCLDHASALVSSDPRMALEFANRARRHDETGEAGWVAPMRAALETLVAAPGEASEQYVPRLATLYSDLGDSAAVIRLLESRQPFEKGGKLAVAYGRACLREGRAAEAADLLGDFVEIRFPEWLAAKRELESERERAYESAIALLNDGKAPRSFYTAYENADSSEQERMVSSHVLEAMAADPRISRLESRIEGMDNPPSVVMDYGIACLQAGHAASPEDRVAWFEKAEKAFLGLREHAEDSPDFQFFLGQVSYWLGKSRQGAELFGQLVETHGGDAALLFEIGNVLRNVGEIDKARDIYKKALEAKPEPDIHTNLIIALAILAETLDETIEYLEKGDPNVPRIAIDLAEAKAARAIEEGRPDAARDLFEFALAEYAKMPATSGTLNNTALIHFKLFSLGGGPFHNSEGLRKMEAALALDPNNSILCMNASERFITSAEMAVLAEAFEPSWMRDSSGYSDLRLLYHDEASRSVVLARFTAHPDFHRGRSFLERALVLAPENQGLLMQALGLAGFLRDAALADNVRSRLENTIRETKTESREEWIATASETTRESALEDYAKIKARHEETRARFESERAQATHDARHAGLRVDMAWWLDDFDPAAELAIIDSAASRWPSSELNGLRIECAQLAAWRALAAARPDVAAWAGQSLRMLDASDLLLLASIHFDDVLDLPGTRDALGLSLENSRRFPSSYLPFDAVLAEILGEADHAAIRDSARQHLTAAIANSQTLKLAPHAPATILRHTWHLWCHEDRDTARAFYIQSADGHPWLPGGK